MSNVLPFPNSDRPPPSLDRHYHPVEAAYAVAQYLPADPALWIERAALAGLVIASGGKDLIIFRGWAGVRADPDQAEFLECWINLTPGGRDAVVALLNQRYGDSV